MQRQSGTEPAADLEKARLRRGLERSRRVLADYKARLSALRSAGTASKLNQPVLRPGGQS